MGRILSFDFAGAAAEDAVPKQEDIKTFFTRLMIYFLCRMFDGTEVDGIHFEAISQFGTLTTFRGKQAALQTWLQKALQLNTDDMMDEYIRLTNLSFLVNCSAPPVFLLDEIQGLCKPTTVQSKLKGNHVIYHSFLSLLLTQLAGKHKPVCICTGTNSGNIINITEKSKIIPQFISLATLHKEEDYIKFWMQRTKYLTVKSNQMVDITGDADMINSLIYASYQIPRLLLIAHKAWFNYKTTSHLTDRIAPLQSYEDNAIQYYAEMAELLFNPNFTVNDIAHILMCCGVQWKVRDINSCVPGTNIEWKLLIESSLIFPYLENCYIIPFRLMWAARTPSTRPVGDYTRTKTGIEELCKGLISNFNINDLFVSYDAIRQLSLYKLGICYETLFASSLAAKYYLRRVEQKQNSIPLLELYDFGGDDKSGSNLLSGFLVDFSSGIHLQKQEVFVNSCNLSSAVIHNKTIQKAHHDIILKGTRSTVTLNIPVSCKASFGLSPDKTIQSQLKISKSNNTTVDLLVWLYLGNENREEQYQNNVVFMNGDGCCNGLALDMLILTKKLVSLNNKS